MQRVPRSRIKEIKITKLADKMFIPEIISQEKDDETYYLIKPNMVEEYEEGTDGYVLLNEKLVSLTPLKNDMTGDLEELEFLIK